MSKQSMVRLQRELRAKKLTEKARLRDQRRKDGSEIGRTIADIRVRLARMRLMKNAEKFKGWLDANSKCFAMCEGDSYALYELPVDQKHGVGHSGLRPMHVGTPEMEGLRYRVTFQVIGVDPNFKPTPLWHIAREGQRFLKFKKSMSEAKWKNKMYWKYGEHCIRRYKEEMQRVKNAKEFLAFVASIYPPKGK